MSRHGRDASIAHEAVVTGSESNACRGLDSPRSLFGLVHTSNFLFRDAIFVRYCDVFFDDPGHSDGYRCWRHLFFINASIKQRLVALSGISSQHSRHTRIWMLQIGQKGPFTTGQITSTDPSKDRIVSSSSRALQGTLGSIGLDEWFVFERLRDPRNSM